MTNYSIDSWLSNQQRQTGSFDFTIFDVSEQSPRTTLTVELLQNLLSRFFFEPNVLEDLRGHVPSSGVRVRHPGDIV